MLKISMTDNQMNMQYMLERVLLETGKMITGNLSIHLYLNVSNGCILLTDSCIFRTCFALRHILKDKVYNLSSHYISSLVNISKTINPTNSLQSKLNSS